VSDSELVARIGTAYIAAEALLREYVNVNKDAK